MLRDVSRPASSSARGRAHRTGRDGSPGAGSRRATERRRGRRRATHAGSCRPTRSRSSGRRRSSRSPSSSGRASVRRARRTASSAAASASASGRQSARSVARAQREARARPRSAAGRARRRAGRCRACSPRARAGGATRDPPIRRARVAREQPDEHGEERQRVRLRPRRRRDEHEHHRARDGGDPGWRPTEPARAGASRRATPRSMQAVSASDTSGMPAERVDPVAGRRARATAGPPRPPGRVRHQAVRVRQPVLHDVAARDEIEVGVAR